MQGRFEEKNIGLCCVCETGQKIGKRNKIKINCLQIVNRIAIIEMKIEIRKGEKVKEMENNEIEKAEELEDCAVDETLEEKKIGIDYQYLTEKLTDKKMSDKKIEKRVAYIKRLERQEEEKEKTIGETFFDILPSENGRPLCVLNERGCEMVQHLASIGCTYEEIAVCLDTTEPTLKSENNCERFFYSYKKGYAEGNQSLRHAQMQHALKGSVPLLIWLGKQRLGQADKIETSQEQAISINGDVPNNVIEQ